MLKSHPDRPRRLGRASLCAALLLSVAPVWSNAADAAGKRVDAAGNIVATAVAEGARASQAPSELVGKLDRDLAARLATERGAEAGPTRVVYMLRASAGARRGAADPAEVALRQAPALERATRRLTQTGQRVIYASPYAGMVVAEATAAGVRAMEALGDVEAIYLERTHRARLDISKVVTQAQIVNNLGFRGQGVRVGVVEPGRIAAHGSLPAGQRVLCRPTSANFVNGHKTNVAGVIQSNNASNTGMGRQLTIVDSIGANFGDAEMMAATDCAIAQGAVAINMSFGSETNGVFNAFARYVDRVADQTGRTIVVAISNFCANRMGSPEIAFNSLAVGSYSDRNTVARGDDRHSCDNAIPAGERHSAFRDPLSPRGDRQEPNMVGPGHRITTTNTTNGFSSVIGTSFAAPHVTGIAGLLNQRRPTLRTQNELVRAILMASARHNIEGATRLSDRDGAGAVQAAAADRVLRNNQAFFFTKPGGATGFPHTQSFQANAGQRVRVATVWSHKQSGSTSTQPTTDLDLTVLGPGGAVVGSSLSFDNAYEIVEFTAPVTGTYTARITNFRPSAGTEHIGLAVSRQDS